MAISRALHVDVKIVIKEILLGSSIKIGQGVHLGKLMIGLKTQGNVGQDWQVKIKYKVEM